MYASSRILYVDNDNDGCELMGLLLERESENYEVIAVNSSEKAVNLLRELYFDLIILDWCLPERSGIELCRMIREADENVPIIFYSAMARPADRVVAKTAGASAYLVKPNDIDELGETVRRLLKENGSSRRDLVPASAFP